MSAKTLLLHHGKHHAAYVAKLNGLIKGTDLAELPLEDIVLQSHGAVFNNAAQHWNHSFFWLCLRPASSAKAGAALHAAIVARFGSLQEFKKHFAEAAVDTFGSGWTWLVSDRRGSLEIFSTGNADNPLRDGRIPLLACDLWEHAYYLDYQDRRPDYLTVFWALVDWDRISQRYAAAGLSTR